MAQKRKAHYKNFFIPNAQADALNQMIEASIYMNETSAVRDAIELLYYIVIEPASSYWNQQYLQNAIETYRQLTLLSIYLLPKEYNYQLLPERERFPVRKQINFLPKNLETVKRIQAKEKLNEEAEVIRMSINVLVAHTLNSLVWKNYKIIEKVLIQKKITIMLIDFLSFIEDANEESNDIVASLNQFINKVSKEIICLETDNKSTDEEIILYAKKISQLTISS